MGRWEGEGCVRGNGGRDGEVREGDGLIGEEGVKGVGTLTFRFDKS